MSHSVVSMDSSIYSNNHSNASLLRLPELKFSMDSFDEEEKDAMSQITETTANRNKATKDGEGGQKFYSILSNPSMDKMMNESIYIIKNPEELPTAVTWTPLRILSIFLLLISLVQIGVAAYISRIIVNHQYGAWWSGFIAFIGSFLALLSPCHPTIMLLTSLTLSPSIVSSIIGAFTQGYASVLFSDLQTCARRESSSSSSPLVLYGQTNGTYAENVVTCFANFAYNPPTPNDCVCVNSALSCTPDERLFRTTDCSLLIDSMPSLLYLSTALCTVLAVLAVLGSVLSCYAVCHREEEKRLKAKKARLRIESQHNIVTDL